MARQSEKSRERGGGVAVAGAVGGWGLLASSPAQILACCVPVSWRERRRTQRQGQPEAQKD